MSKVDDLHPLLLSSVIKNNVLAKEINENSVLIVPALSRLWRRLQDCQTSCMYIQSLVFQTKAFEHTAL